MKSIVVTCGRGARAAPPCSPSLRRPRGRARGAAPRAPGAGGPRPWARASICRRPAAPGVDEGHRLIGRRHEILALTTESSDRSSGRAPPTCGSSISQAAARCSWRSGCGEGPGSKPPFSPGRRAAGAPRRCDRSIAGFARVRRPRGPHPARQAAVMGIVEGLTEFARLEHRSPDPRRLAVRHDRRQVEVFDIAIQTGAILAVIIVYWQRLSTAVPSSAAARGPGASSPTSRSASCRRR